MGNIFLKTLEIIVAIDKTLVHCFEIRIDVLNLFWKLVGLIDALK